MVISMRLSTCSSVRRVCIDVLMRFCTPKPCSQGTLLTGIASVMFASMAKAGKVSLYSCMNVQCQQTPLDHVHALCTLTAKTGLAGSPATQACFPLAGQIAQKGAAGLRCHDHGAYGRPRGSSSRRK